MEYRVDQELPEIPLCWRDRDNEIRDFSAGWTFTVHLVRPTEPGTALVTKTTGITGGATCPNVTVAFTEAELATLATALGAIPARGVATELVLYARSGGLDDVFPGQIPIVWLPKVTPAA